MHFGSPSDPSQISVAEAKPRYIYLISKQHGQSKKCPVRLLLCKAKPSNGYAIFEKLSPPQSWSQVVVCVSTPRMYPRSGYLLVTNKNILKVMIFTRFALYEMYFTQILFIFTYFMSNVYVKRNRRAATNLPCSNQLFVFKAHRHASYYIGWEIIEVIKRNRAQFNFSCSGCSRRYLLSAYSLGDAIGTVQCAVR